MLTFRDINKLEQILAERTLLKNFIADPLDYQNLRIVKNLSKTKFPVYLAVSKISEQYYAMKVFAHLNGDYHPCFKNEIRFSFLKHPNIITWAHFESERQVFYKGKLTTTSYILTDYAPYGDFFEFVINHKADIDDKLVRTYFRQLIEGIKYLHQNDVAHLDLKPENLLLGADFNLKIIDFDLSYATVDGDVLSSGTKYYRPPEFFRSSIRNESPVEPFAADVYSAGIILFIMKSRGMYPHTEDDIVDGINFVDLMDKNNSGFWSKHCEIEGRKASFYDNDFKELFNGMTRLKANDRLSLQQIQQSKWYNGPVYSLQELNQKMRHLCMSSAMIDHK